MATTRPARRQWVGVVARIGTTRRRGGWLAEYMRLLGESRALLGPEVTAGLPLPAPEFAPPDPAQVDDWFRGQDPEDSAGDAGFGALASVSMACRSFVRPISVPAAARPLANLLTAWAGRTGPSDWSGRRPGAGAGPDPALDPAGEGFVPCRFEATDGSGASGEARVVATAEGVVARWGRGAVVVVLDYRGDAVDLRELPALLTRHGNSDVVGLLLALPAVHTPDPVVPAGVRVPVLGVRSGVPPLMLAALINAAAPPRVRACVAFEAPPDPRREPGFVVRRGTGP